MSRICCVWDLSVKDLSHPRFVVTRVCLSIVLHVLGGSCPRFVRQLFVISRVCRVRTCGVTVCLVQGLSTPRNCRGQGLLLRLGFALLK
jgi:hypothetical protein